MRSIQIQNLSKRFGSFQALADINLSVHEGEFLGLLGPSGCGKTTTLNIIAGFETPTSGKVLVDGHDITNVPVNKRHFGIVFQSYALFPHMTVAENVAFGLEMHKVPKVEREKAVRHSLDLVQLEHLAHRYPRALSGGQQQRVALARALAIEPSLLLLDEPLSNLDAKLREEMQVELRLIQQRSGTTTIMVTHDQSEALAACDRIAVMHQGRIIQQTDPISLYNKPNSEFAARFVGKSTILEATITKSDDRVAQVLLRGNKQETHLTVSEQWAEGTEILVAIRPEKIVLDKSDNALLSGKVTTRVFQGQVWHYTIDTQAGSVVACVLNNGQSGWEIGADIGISWNPDDAVIMRRSHDD